MNVFEYILEHRVKGDEGFEPSNPDCLTKAQPGTLAKVNTLCDRVERGESLWHPGDTNCFPHGGPC